MHDDKPLITKNQATYIAYKARKKPAEKKSRKKFFIRETILVIFTFVILLAAANYPAIENLTKYWWKNSIAKSEPTTKTTTTQPTKKPPTATPIFKDSRIIISKINVEAPIVWDIAFDNIHTNLNDGVVHYNESAKPGQIGNVFLVGHSSDYVWSKGKYKTIFSLLPKLTAGDEIKITNQGVDYIYQVKETKIVAPTDIDIIKPTDDATLTLMTCWPIGTSQKRYVVVAKLTSPEPQGKQSTYPSILGLPASR